MSLESKRGTQLADPGAEFIDRVTGLWERYSRIVLGVLIAAVVIGVIAFFTLRARAASEDAAAGKLAEANVLFWQGDYARSLQGARQVNEQYGSTASGVDALRLAGDNAYWSGDFKAAADWYKKYLDRQKSGLIADAVRRSYAYALESSGQPAEAVPVYESVVGRFDREASAEFLAAAARCRVAAGQPAEAEKLLQRLLDEFGETSYSPMARVHLAELQVRPR